MHAGTGVLAVAGSVCMTLALVLAWCLAGVRSSRFVKAVPYAHSALVTDRAAAQTSIQAIREVVHAVRSNVALDESL